jgi:hypothetical protein
VLFIYLIVFKIETIDNKGLRRSRRMQGIPLEGYKPLPPNSPEYFYREEVENHSDAGSAATPLLENIERALVTVEEDSIIPINPVSQVPLEPLLLNWTRQVMS